MSKGLLVISRRRDEVIDMLLPDGTVIEVMVCDVQPGKVRIGVRAPANVTILRRELRQATVETR